MSDYTDAASRFGQNKGTGDDRALFLTQFGGMVINAYTRALDWDSLRIVKRIQSGKSDTFPVIGIKRDAAEHEAGELIKGGTILSGQVEITLDKMVYDSIFVAEIDELISHFSVREPYANQLGQSLGILQSKRIAIMHILASRRLAAAQGPGQPTPSYSYNASMRTSAVELENAMWAGRQFLLENEISGADPKLMLPHQQYLLLARNFGLATDGTAANPQAGSGSRVTGKVGQIVGFSVEGTNNLPSTNITTGLAKYQGDFSVTVGTICSPVAVGSLERRGMRLVVKDQEERLGTIMIASQFNGHGILRGEASYELATTVRA